MPSTTESGATSGAKATMQRDLADTEHRDPLQAAPAGIGEHGRSEREDGCDDDEADVVLNDDRKRLDHVRDAGGAVDAEIRHDRAREGQRVAAHACHRGGGEDAGERLERPPTRPRAGCTASGSSAIAPTAASTGPATNSSPARASRQKTASHATASAAYATAAAWATLPSGKTGTKSAIARPRRGALTSQPRLRARAARTSPGVQKGSSAAAKVTVPAASAAGISWRSSGTRPRRASERRRAWRGRDDFERSRRGEVSAVRRAVGELLGGGPARRVDRRARTRRLGERGGRSGRAVLIGFAPASIAAAT